MVRRLWQACKLKVQCGCGDNVRCGRKDRRGRATADRRCHAEAGYGRRGGDRSLVGAAWAGSRTVGRWLIHRTDAGDAVGSTQLDAQRRPRNGQGLQSEQEEADDHTHVIQHNQVCARSWTGSPAVTAPRSGLSAAGGWVTPQNAPVFGHRYPPLVEPGGGFTFRSPPASPIAPPRRLRHLRGHYAQHERTDLRPHYFTDCCPA